MGGTPLKSVSTRFRVELSISAWDSGQSATVSTRPTSASATRGSDSTLAEPVSRNWPGSGSRSTIRLISSKTSGARWTSSIATGRSSPATNPTGSSDAARRAPASSKVT
jgi:hypothetical protein